MNNNIIFRLHKWKFSTASNKAGSEARRQTST